MVEGEAAVFCPTIDTLRMYSLSAASREEHVGVRIDQTTFAGVLDPLTEVAHVTSPACQRWRVPSLNDPNSVMAIVDTVTTPSIADTGNGRLTIPHAFKTRSKHKMRVNAPLDVPGVPTGIA